MRPRAQVKSAHSAVTELGVPRNGQPATAHEKTVYSLAISPDSTLMATGSRDFTIKLWHTHSTECAHTLVGHKNFVFAVVLHPKVRMETRTAASPFTRPSGAPLLVLACR